MKVITQNQYIDLPPCAATIGFFDGVHRGHRYLIEQLQAKATAAGLSTTVITFSQHPRQVVATNWQPKLLTSLDEKIDLLSKTGIDQLVILPFDRQMAAFSAHGFMEQILRDKMKVRLLMTGYDNRFGHNREEGFDDYVRYGQELGITVCLGLPLIADNIKISSSTIRRLLDEGNMTEAHQCLGRDYSLTGSVVGGHQIGRQLGFPTANIELKDPNRLVPAPGVYGIKVRINDSETWKNAMMNIGNRPTFDGHNQTLEAHIFDYEGDLYGSQIAVNFIFRHRSEQRFESPHALISQLRADAKLIEQKLQKEKES